MPQCERECSTGFPGQCSIDLSHLTPEGIVLHVKEQGDFITLRVPVQDPEPALHERFYGIDHKIPEPEIKRCLKLADFLGQAGE